MEATQWLWNILTRCKREGKKMTQNGLKTSRWRSWVRLSGSSDLSLTAVFVSSLCTTSMFHASPSAMMLVFAFSSSSLSFVPPFSSHCFIFLSLLQFLILFGLLRCASLTLFWSHRSPRPSLFWSVAFLPDFWSPGLSFTWWKIYSCFWAEGNDWRKPPWGSLGEPAKSA